MQVIPVIDLMHGQVVRAVRGDRAAYRPIVSGLCAGSDPANIARALVVHTASPVVYVADLDALRGGAPQTDVLMDLLHAVPGVQCWWDAGFADADAAHRACQSLASVAQRVRPVYASEALHSLEALRAALDPDLHADGGLPGLLSLDRRGDQTLDPAGCWSHPQLWPLDIIVMTLERVGAGSGPDLDTLRAVQALAPQARLVGAGGVRHAADLDAAARAGAHAWLVASALHDGLIPAAPAAPGPSPAA